MADSPFTSTPEELLPILADLQRREPIFHRPDFASSSEQFRNLMAPDYWEVGASGRRYSVAFILEHLATRQPESAEAAGWTTSDFACRRLGLDTYLLTYTLLQGDRRTRRATIWRLDTGSWQILYHQGTVITDNEDDLPPP